MSHSKNQMSLLTPLGEGALQVFQLSHPDQRVLDLIDHHFEARRPHPSILRLGMLKDAQGEILDEIFLERHKEKILFHLHGGSMSLFRLKKLLSEWGCQEIDEEFPQNLEKECLWALQHAHTQEATDVALKNLKLLPDVKPSQKLLDSYDYGRSLFTAVKYFLFGAPNAGKSSLINRLLQRERVVVDAQAGTTRDLIEVDLTVFHRKILLVDAAGLRKSDDELEKKGQEFLETACTSGRILWVVNPHVELQPCPFGKPVALVLTHQDIGKGQAPEFEGPVLRTGAHDQGEEILDFFEKDLPSPVAAPVLFTSRQFHKVSQGVVDRANWMQQDWLG